MQNILRFLREGVARLRHEKAEAVVAPVVGKALLVEVAVDHIMMDRQQLQRGDTQLLQMADEDVRGESTIGAPQVGFDVRVPQRRASHVSLVDDRFVPWPPQWRVIAPIEGTVHYTGK